MFRNKLILSIVVSIKSTITEKSVFFHDKVNNFYEPLLFKMSVETQQARGGRSSADTDSRSNKYQTTLARSRSANSLKMQVRLVSIIKKRGL